MHVFTDYYVIQTFLYTFFLVKTGGGGNELSLRFIILLLHGLSCVFTVMSDINLDEPGFTAPGGFHGSPVIGFLGGTTS